MNRQQWIVFGVSAALIVATGGLLLKLKHSQRLGEPGLKHLEVVNDNGGPELAIDLPSVVMDYTSEAADAVEVEALGLPSDTTITKRRYSSVDGFQVALTVVMMGRDRTSIHKPQFCLEGQGWSITQSDLTSIPISKPHRYDLPVMQLQSSKEISYRDTSGGVRKANATGLYLYWFVADNQLTAKHWERMWWMARDLFTTGVLQRWAYVSCFAAVPPGREAAALERMRDFIAAAVPKFQIATTGETISKKVALKTAPN